MANIYEKGSKVTATVRHKNIPAIITACCGENKFMLKVALHNEFAQSWIVSDLPGPVRGRDLVGRAGVIPGLDE